MKLFWTVLIMFNVMTSSAKCDTPSSAKTESSFVLIMTGPPGCGKGTHASPLSKELQLPHISTGDLFREHLKKGTPLGLKAKNFIEAGNLVPDEVVIEMLFERVSEEDCENGYILDGFPRTIAQAKALDFRLNEKAHMLVLNFELDDDTIVERITGRLSCKNCGKLYHRQFYPPRKELTCDECQGELFQRIDDQESIIRKRLEVYRAETKPLIEYYSSQKGILKNIDSKSSKDQVLSDCYKATSEFNNIITGETGCYLR